MKDVHIVGRTTKDIELKEIGEKKTKLCEFSLAVEDYSSNDTTTEFYDFKAWGKNAEFMQKYISKGQRIIISGELKQSIYENAEKKKIKQIYILVEKIEFADSKKGE